jgi:hypothetical protein
METTKSRLGRTVHMDTKKLKNQKNYTMKNKKITEMKTEEIKKKLQNNKRSHANKSEGEQLQQLCTMNAGVQKQNLAPTTEEMQIHQQRDYISKNKKIKVHITR